MEVNLNNVAIKQQDLCPCPESTEEALGNILSVDHGQLVGINIVKLPAAQCRTGTRRAK
jgi:hypothetical protein